MGPKRASLRSSSSVVSAGLAIAKSVVELSSGRLWADDNPDGSGSTFFVALPRHATKTPVVSALTTAPICSTGSSEVLYASVNITGDRTAHTDLRETFSKQDAPVARAIEPRGYDLGGTAAGRPQVEDFPEPAPSVAG